MRGERTFPPRLKTFKPIENGVQKSSTTEKEDSKTLIDNANKTVALGVIAYNKQYILLRDDPSQASRTGPYFDANSPKEITVAIGTTAHIPCMARNTGTKPVSVLFW